MRRYRELSAQINAAGIPVEELDRLRTNLTYLQAISNKPLPQGDTLDNLARQLREWFLAIGYGLEQDVHRFDVHAEMVVKMSRRRSGYDRILVRAVDGEIEVADVHALKNAIDGHAFDQGWLVSERRVSKAARKETEKHDNLFVYTLDELIDEEVNWDRYFSWLEEEVKTKGVDRYYVHLAGTVDDFDIKGKKLGSSRYEKLDDYFQRWLDDPSKEYVSILGEFGTGKTCIMVWKTGSWQEEEIPHSHEGMIEAISWSYDGKWLACGAIDGKVKIWDAQTWQVKTQLPGHDAAITAIAWDPKGSFIATGDTQGGIRLWNVDSGEIVRRLVSLPTISALHFNASGTHLAIACGLISRLLVWVFESDSIVHRDVGQFLSHYGLYGLELQKLDLKSLKHLGFPEWVPYQQSIVLAPDGSYVVILGKDSAEIREVDSKQNRVGEHVKELGGQRLRNCEGMLIKNMRGLDDVTRQYLLSQGANDTYDGSLVNWWAETAYLLSLARSTQHKNPGILAINTWLLFCLKSLPIPSSTVLFERLFLFAHLTRHASGETIKVLGYRI